MRQNAPIGRNPTECLPIAAGHVTWAWDGVADHTAGPSSTRAGACSSNTGWASTANDVGLAWPDGFAPRRAGRAASWHSPPHLHAIGTLLRHGLVDVDVPSAVGQLACVALAFGEQSGGRIAVLTEVQR